MISDLFLGDSFCVSYINPYQEQLLKQNILIENGVKKDFSKNVYQQNGLNKIELGILNKNTLIHLAKLYKNSLKQSNMIIVDSKSNQGFVLDNLDIKRKVCIDSLNGYAKEVARNLKGNRVLVISRAAYLIKTQYSKFDKIKLWPMLHPHLSKSNKVVERSEQIVLSDETEATTDSALEKETQSEVENEKVEEVIENEETNSTEESTTTDELVDGDEALETTEEENNN